MLGRVTYLILDWSAAHLENEDNYILLARFPQPFLFVITHFRKFTPFDIVQLLFPTRTFNVPAKLSKAVDTVHDKTLPHFSLVSTLFENLDGQLTMGSGIIVLIWKQYLERNFRALNFLEA